MRYDIHFRNDVNSRIHNVVGKIKDWNGITYNQDKDGIAAFAEKVVFFEDCSVPDRPFLIGGADGSGDFPCVKYGDSFVYLTVAMTRLYEAMPNGILGERKLSDHDIVDFLWLPEAQETGKKCFKEGFARMLGESLESICEKSDYYQIKKEYGKVSGEKAGLLDNRVLILPPAHESSNIGIQLLTVAEAASLIRLMKSDDLKKYGNKPIYLLQDTTMALPMVKAKSVLFFEIVKRYACVLARENNVAYLTVSKSHNMPHMDLIEDFIKTIRPVGEHWFIRIPSKVLKEDTPLFLEERTIPPVGAISYLFKCHKTTQPIRLDMDYNYWKEHIQNEDKEIQRQNEIQLFRDLDFASHDQRCYGYPYPIKACHDLVSMTENERLALRKQIVEEGIRAGLKRKNFVDPSIQTGHA